MSNLREMSDGFKIQYEKFLHGCDALEEINKWDTSADGDMETYYFNDILCIIIKLISADGNFSEEEAGYINDMFGFSYSPEELKDLYKANGADISRMIDIEIPAAYAKMRSINTGLADLYRNMLIQACAIVSESDGIIHIAEKKQIDRIKASLAG